MIVFKSIRSSCKNHAHQQFKRLFPQMNFHSSSVHQFEEKLDEDETFRVLELVKKKFVRPKRIDFTEKFFVQPREQREPVDQNWGNVWPNARSFHPSTVPFPVRMGVPYKGKVSPSKYGNAELMKIPNFLHLTPPVVERQCKVLKKFCTKWPANLETEEKQDYHFPVTISKSSYVYATPSIREPKSRIVTLKVSIDSLKLDEHGIDKLLRLVKERFDPATRYLTIVADRCPLSSQNEEYCDYLLSVIYNESVKTEPWEHEKDVNDVSSYTWEGSPAENSAKILEESLGKKFSEDDLQKYNHSVSYIHNDKESLESLDAYRDAVLNLLNLKTTDTNITA